MASLPAYSMTGSGHATGPTELGVAHVEIRSVNGRTLVFKHRLCPECQGLEAALESRIGQRIRRGNVLVTMDLSETKRKLVIDRDMAESAVTELRDLSKQLELVGDVQVRDLAMVPGLFSEGGGQRPRTSWEPPEKLGALVDETVDQLVEGRRQEGSSTVAAMTSELDRLGELLTQARARAANTASDQREKLLRRVNEFLEKHGQRLEESDVIREVALIVDRADISEETQRLSAHLDKIREHLQQGGQIGRALEFLLQEALREANTMGSKSQDAGLAQIAVDLKSGVDKLKEQAANLE